MISCRVEKVIGNILNMKQGEWTIKVELNEHYEFQFLEVMGPLEAIEDHVLYSSSLSRRLSESD